MNSVTTIRKLSQFINTFRRKFRYYQQSHTSQPIQHLSRTSPRNNTPPTHHIPLQFRPTRCTGDYLRCPLQPLQGTSVTYYTPLPNTPSPKVAKQTNSHTHSRSAFFVRIRILICTCTPACRRRSPRRRRPGRRRGAERCRAPQLIRLIELPDSAAPACWGKLGGCAEFVSFLSSKLTGKRQGSVWRRLRGYC